jgi:hypothetical protein
MHWPWFPPTGTLAGDEVTLLHVDSWNNNPRPSSSAELRAPQPAVHNQISKSKKQRKSPIFFMLATGFATQCFGYITTVKERVIEDCGKMAWVASAKSSDTVLSTGEADAKRSSVFGKRYGPRL